MAVLAVSGPADAAPRLRSPARTVASHDEVQRLFLREGWTDGLPVIPPTPGLVEAFVTASGHDADHVVGRIPEQARDLTVEKLAINAAMAGCATEAMPVLVTAVAAMADDAFNLHSTTVSGATAPLLIIGGPVVDAVGVNAGFSVFGPGEGANATLGRALRLVLQNLCGGRPGVMDVATMGHPGKYSYCIGEHSARNPWGPLHGDRGVAADASAVTVFAGEAPIAARNDWAQEPEVILATVADAMGVGHFTGGCYVVVLGPLHAERIASAGWSKADVRGFLHQTATRSTADLKRAGRVPGAIEPGDEHDRRAAVASPDDVLVAVAGGHLYGYSAVIPPWVGGDESRPVTRRIADG